MPTFYVYCTCTARAGRRAHTLCVGGTHSAPAPARPVGWYGASASPGQPCPTARFSRALHLLRLGCSPFQPAAKAVLAKALWYQERCTALPSIPAAAAAVGGSVQAGSGAPCCSSGACRGLPRGSTFWKLEATGCNTHRGLPRRDCTCGSTPVYCLGRLWVRATSLPRCSTIVNSTLGAEQAVDYRYCPASASHTHSHAALRPCDTLAPCIHATPAVLLALRPWAANAA